MAALIFFMPLFDNVMLIFLHWEAGSLFPPFKYMWTSDYGTRDTLWLLGLSYNKHYDCSLILLECSPLESSRMSMYPSHSPSGGPSWQPAFTSTQVSKEPEDDAASSFPGCSAALECSGDELSPTELFPNTDSWAKKYCCLNTQTFGIICYTARGN